MYRITNWYPSYPPPLPPHSFLFYFQKCNCNLPFHPQPPIQVQRSRSRSRLATRTPQLTVWGWGTPGGCTTAPSVALALLGRTLWGATWGSTPRSMRRSVQVFILLHLGDFTFWFCFLAFIFLKIRYKLFLPIFRKYYRPGPVDGNGENNNFPSPNMVLYA